LVQSPTGLLPHHYRGSPAGHLPRVPAPASPPALLSPLPPPLTVQRAPQGRAFCILVEWGMHVESVEQLKEEAGNFLQKLTIGEKATVVGLIGELGAGKTSFVQGVAEALGITESVTSPTFVLEKIYQLVDAPFGQLIHIDAYRLDGEHELKQLDWDTLIGNPKNLIVIEWADRVMRALPEGTRIVTLTHSKESRDISYGSK